MAAPPRQGAIVWAVVPDPNGVAKRRPLVVITSDDEIAAAPKVAAVAITTTFREPPPPDYVGLPWDPTGRSATGPRRESFAVCGWVVAVPKEYIQAEPGYVPPAVLLQFLAKLPKP